MAIRDVIGTGVLVAGVAAATMVAQNQLQISGTGRQLPSVQQGTVADAAADTNLPAPGSSTRATFVDAGPLALNRIDGRSYIGGILLHNPSCVTEQLSLIVLLLDRNGDPLPVRTSVERIVDGLLKPIDPTMAGEQRWSLRPGEYDQVRLSVSPPSSSAGLPGHWDAVRAALLSTPMDYAEWTGHLPARGTLVLTRHTPLTDPASKDPCRIMGAAPSAVRRPFVLQPPLPSSVDTGVLLGSLLLAALTSIVVAGIIATSSDMFLRGRMGDVAFDFKTSWGANVAIGAGIVTALTNGAVLSQDQYSSNSTTYLVLATLFATMVPLGAALYGLIRPPVSVDGGTERQGYVSVYLLSSGVVLWGAFGQLLLLGMILRELALARVLSQAPAGVLIVVTKGMIALLMVYAFMSAIATIKATSQRATTPGTSTPRPAAQMV